MRHLSNSVEKSQYTDFQITRFAIDWGTLHVNKSLTVQNGIDDIFDCELPPHFAGPPIGMVSNVHNHIDRRPVGRKPHVHALSSASRQQPTVYLKYATKHVPEDSREIVVSSICL